jgi:predicted deacetylase
MKNIILEFDDLHFDDRVDCLSVATELISKNKDIVLNFFVPTMYGGRLLPAAPKGWLAEFKSHISNGNITVGIHGFDHSTLEFKNLTYEVAVSRIKAAEAVLNYSDIAYKKVFRAPQWGINSNVVEALIDLEYTHLYSHTDYNHITDKYKDKIKVIHYNFNLKDEWPRLENPLQNPEIVVAHGHTSKYPELNCNNGIWDVKNKVMELSEKFFCLRLDQI